LRLIALPLLLSACSAPASYMGLDLRTPPGNRGIERLQRLARTAQAGSKAAQLELGRMFEDGNGVPEDADRACRLYEAAAATTGGTIYVYSPPVGKGGSGRVIPITTPIVAGLPVARERLQSLRYRIDRAERAGSACLAAGG
jgi:hypothetical protein